MVRWAAVIDELTRPLDEFAKGQLSLKMGGHFAGTLAFDERTRVAIVGTRKPSPIAESYAHRIAAELAGRNCIVVSGGALGIDCAAHEGALEANGVTWLVMPEVAPRIYPVAHEKLCERVVERGAIVWPFVSTPHFSGRFHARNAVLVRAAHAVIVVQAGENSGALSAGRAALRFRRPLWVVPGAPLLEGFDGSVELIAKGGRALFRITDVLEDLGVLVDRSWVPPATPPVEPPKQILLPFGHDSTQAAIWACLSESPKHQENIAIESGVAPFATQGALLTLTLENVVVEGPPGFFRRAYLGTLTDNR